MHTRGPHDSPTLQFEVCKEFNCSLCIINNFNEINDNNMTNYQISFSKIVADISPNRSKLQSLVSHDHNTGIVAVSYL